MTDSLNSALETLGELMAYNLTQQGVTASASDGLTTLANKILDISGGSCYHLELSEHSVTTTGTFTISATLQEDYQLKSGATVTFTGGTSTVTATTDSNGVATATITFNQSGTLTATYGNVSDTCTVTIAPNVIWEDNFNRSTLGSDWVTFGTGATASISNNQLVLTRSGNGRGGVYYNTVVTGDYKITIDFVSGDYDTIELGLAISGTSWKMYEVQPKWYFAYITINSSGTISNTLHEQRTSGITYSSATIVYEVIKDTSIKMYINGTLKGTYNVQDGTTDGYLGVAQCCGRTSKYNSIKVEPL